MVLFKASHEQDNFASMNYMGALQGSMLDMFN